MAAAAASQCLLSGVPIHFSLEPWSCGKMNKRENKLGRLRVTHRHSWCGRAPAQQCLFHCKGILRRSSLCFMAFSSFPAVASDAVVSDVEAHISLAFSTGRLDLSYHGLEEVPLRVFQIVDLVDLSLAGNKISSLPDDIKNLVNLRRLGLAGNRLQELPASIGDLQQLEGLWITGNMLHSLPAEIGNLKHLRMLALDGNKISSLPESISGLQELQVLSVAGNNLQEIPAGIGSLKVLKVLAAHGNQLQWLPDALTQLSSLQDLWIQGNKLKALPENLGGLCSLQQLSLADNLLEALPESMGQLLALKTLWLYGNKLKRGPRSLATMKKLLHVWLESNPLEGQYLRDILPTIPRLNAFGVTSDVEFLEDIPEVMKNVVTVTKIAGSGAAQSCGGYFKLQQWNPQEKSDIIVVAFGSAPGVPNWGGVLRKAKMEIRTQGSISVFDTLYVVDSQRSWYTHEDCWELDRSNAEEKCQQAGPQQPRLGGYYQMELEISLKSYKHVIMLGDSMGASAALLFSRLATSVLAFCPQVDLSTSSIRPGQDDAWLQAFQQEILQAVSASSAKICVHCGTWSHDIDQAKLLPASKVKLEVHNVDDHRLAKELDTQKKLVSLVLQEINEANLACTT
ncbi:unnamed protein product [Sphagnum troendelagicum]